MDEVVEAMIAVVVCTIAFAVVATIRGVVVAI